MRFANLLIFTLLTNLTFAQESNFWVNSDTLNKTRFRSVLITESVLAVSSIVILNEIWYKNYPQTSIHLFDDSKEWLYMDKFGHATTAYYIGLSGIELMKWSGVKGKKRTLIGGGLGFIYLTGVELLDGTSSQWGFSTSDILANTAGTALVIGQDLAWQEQRIRLKISAHLTDYAQFRPNLLGETIPERLLKDYNGQTIWLSANIHSFLNKNTKFPKWLNLAIGIGAEEMISGEVMTPVIHNNRDISNQFNRYQQYYLSFDIDLSKIKLKQKWAKTILGSFGLIKFPLPTIMFSKKGNKFYPFYF